MISDAQMYTEVFEILSYMEKDVVMKIPYDLLEFIKKERDLEYQTKIDKNDIFNPNNIDEGTINFLTGLNIDYIADEEKKEKLIEICKENDRKAEEIKKEKYSSIVLNNNIIFENEVEKNSKDNSLIKRENRGNIFSKILMFLKKYFRR